MTTLKEDAIKLFTGLPDNTNVDEMMYRLYVVDRIRRGEQDINEGKVISQEDAEKQSEKW